MGIDEYAEVLCDYLDAHERKRLHALLEDEDTALEFLEAFKDCISTAVATADTLDKRFDDEED